MEKTYLIKILAKKDATLNYKAAMALTQKVLADETGVADPKIILRFKWYRPSQEVFESFYSTAVWGTKIAFERYQDLIPNIALKDVVSFKALYKGIMNVFVKIDDEIQTYGENIIAITDYANLLLTIISEITKTNYIRKTFHDEHIANSNINPFLSHILVGAALGIARWFGYRILHQDDGHELIQKLYMMNIDKIKGFGHDNINDILFLIEDLLNYIEKNSYFIEEFTEADK
ncbi:hypothetical protein [Spiroplasma citri]|uniref:Hypothetical transmembrane protein n=1 Tax=Spiroplasma citri TaxID=2133 RepID=Q14MS3_SPICI|nr:hypothetical protein [Spiroplasma citri]APE75338.1 hypothetical protein SCITRI_001463 [Spiroplasma citri]QIA67563.1 hypothetical protein GMI18_08010 [Spiroplasma citri]QIA69410.1 hypothetical protein GL298_07920 [Spiroplasma citri]QIA71274.1 hypothetical protein GL981_07955 [Spiroplasma citri]QIA73409.1 hypothetical protein GL982_07230 [Spiroplasma citri]